MSLTSSSVCGLKSDFRALRGNCHADSYPAHTNNTINPVRNQLIYHIFQPTAYMNLVRDPGILSPCRTIVGDISATFAGKSIFL